MLDLIARGLFAAWRRVDRRAQDVDDYGFGGRAWTGR